MADERLGIARADVKTSFTFDENQREMKISFVLVMADSERNIIVEQASRADEERGPSMLVCSTGRAWSAQVQTSPKYGCILHSKQGVNFIANRVYSSFAAQVLRSSCALSGSTRVGPSINLPLIPLALPPIDCPLVNLPNFCLTTRSRGIRMRGIVCEAGFAAASHAGPAHDRVLAGKMSYKGDIVCLE